MPRTICELCAVAYIGPPCTLRPPYTSTAYTTSAMPLRTNSAPVRTDHLQVLGSAWERSPPRSGRQIPGSVQRFC